MSSPVRRRPPTPGPHDIVLDGGNGHAIRVSFPVPHDEYAPRLLVSAYRTLHGTAAHGTAPLRKAA